MRIESDSSEKSDAEGNADEATGKPREKVNPARKMCYFCSETGHSLSFVLLRDNLTQAEISETKELIEKHKGIVSTSKGDVGSYSAVLVDDEATSWNYSEDVFKLSYIQDCIEAGQVLNISTYLKRKSKWFVENFDYMKVFYFRKYSWNTVPEIFNFSRPRKSHTKAVNKVSNKICSDSDSSVDSLDLHDAPTLPSPNYSRSKNTKRQYSKGEKEALLRYVVENNAYKSVKGKKIYRDMEAANICPIRTWQSMKDHFLRILAKEIDTFSILSKDQKHKLKTALSPYC